MRGFKTFSQNLPPIEAIAQGSTGDANPLDGDYISMKNAPNGVAVVVHIDQANAATIAISINQATAVAGTGAKALANSVPIFTNLDCAAGDLLTRQTDAVSYTTDAGVKHKIVIFEIRPEDLDVANGFDCISVSCAQSNAANLIGAVYVPLGRRYANESMIAD